MMAGRIGKALLATLLAGLACAATARTGIYTCTDAQGRRITSDRMIPECNDREQKVMNPSGTVRATLPPSPTGPELRAREEQARAEAEDQRRKAEEKRVLKALVLRYPSQPVHDGERAKALESAEEMIQAAQRHIEDLERERKALDTEAEFFRKNPAKMPVKLRRQLEENEAQVATQRKLIAAQEEEQRRINARFDEELAKLRSLWAAARGVAAAPPATPPTVRR
jgi:hypothetical protein